MKQRARAWAALHRMEFPAYYLFVFAWAGLLSIDSLSVRIGTLFLAGACINVCCSLGGALLDSYANRALDARELLKAHLSQAGRLIGERQMRVVIAAEYGLTIILTLAVAMAAHSLWLLIVVSLCVLGDAAYNLEPFRLKRRGVGNPVVIFFRCGAFPGLIPWFALHPGSIATPMLLVCLGMALFFTARQLEHAIPDTEQDRLAGVSTPAVLYGARPVLKAVVLLVLGATLPLFLGFSGFVGPLWAGIGTAGCAVTLVGAIRLLAVASDEQDILTRLHTAEADSRWRRISAAIYVLFLVPGVIHVCST